MSYFITITTDWITAISTLISVFIAGIGLSSLFAGFLKNRKIPKEKRKLIEDQKKQLEVLPFFTIHSPSLQSTTVTIIKLRNNGARAMNLMIVVPFIGKGPTNLKVDKYEVEKNEVITITLLDNLIDPVIVPIHMSISYFDIDKRRYQQSYAKIGPKESITEPEWLTNK